MNSHFSKTSIVSKKDLRLSACTVHHKKSYTKTKSLILFITFILDPFIILVNKKLKERRLCNCILLYFAKSAALEGLEIRQKMRRHFYEILTNFLQCIKSF